MNALTSEDSFPTRASLRRATRPVPVPEQDVFRTIPPIPQELAPDQFVSPRTEHAAITLPSTERAAITSPPMERAAIGSARTGGHSASDYGVTAPTTRTVHSAPTASVAPVEEVAAMFGLNAVGIEVGPAGVGVSGGPVEAAGPVAIGGATAPGGSAGRGGSAGPGGSGAPRVVRTAILDLGVLQETVPAGGPAVDGEAELAIATSTVPEGADVDLLRALMQVVEAGGSDLHITGNAGPTLRVDGRLRQIDGTAVWSREKVRAALFSMLTDEQRDNFAQVLELDFALTLASGARFRVNLYQQRGAIGGAFRLVPTRIKPLEELGIPETIGKFAALPRGLVLVTGPTGSGKSTTLAALIDLVNRTRADHIVTVEDPIEFLHSNKKSLVNQREVGTDTHSFAAALKHVLRQDPDVILIGELRDLETISVALTAAETGHLVFATLHTQDAAQSIDRLIDVFPPFQQAQVRAQLASTLQGVVCQMLLRRADGEGRVVATEVLVTTPAIANLIREGRTHQVRSAMQAGRQLGMHTADQRLAELVNLGTITHAAAYEKAQDIAGLRQLIQREEPAGSAAPLAAGGVDFGDTFSGVGPTR
jgi:twitching motility protein PilT